MTHHSKKGSARAQRCPFFCPDEFLAPGRFFGYIETKKKTSKENGHG